MQASHCTYYEHQNRCDKHSNIFFYYGAVSYASEWLTMGRLADSCGAITDSIISELPNGRTKQYSRNRWI